MFRLSRQNSQLMKGIAILMMLFLHLFMAGGIPDDILPTGYAVFRHPHVLNAKACVSLFAFVTGYGFAFAAAGTPSSAGTGWRRISTGCLLFFPTPSLWLFPWARRQAPNICTNTSKRGSLPCFEFINMKRAEEEHE